MAKTKDTTRETSVANGLESRDLLATEERSDVIYEQQRLQQALEQAQADNRRYLVAHYEERLRQVA